ncbi:FimV family protein [Halopseudomonas pelagia]|nr:FimV/HubP family polar landmark protein [Halopseudomonas pelagia]
MAVKRQVIAGVATLAALYVGVSNALGLGELRLDSALNQPLSASIQLQGGEGLSPEDIRVSLANQEAFQNAGIDRPFFLTDLRFVPVVENNRLFIRVESTRPVREPFLNFLVELRRPNGRMLREYTLLLDPPLYDPQAGAIANATPPAPAAGSRRPIVAAAQPRDQVQSAEPRSEGQQSSDPQFAQSELPEIQPASGADEYTTVSGDTLWDIAAAQRPDSSVDIPTSMLAIRALNPDAFVNGNINRLRANQRLVLPTREQLVTSGAPVSIMEGVAVDEPESTVEPTQQPVVEAAPQPQARPEEDPSELATPEVVSEAEPDEGIDARLRIEESSVETAEADSEVLLDRLRSLEGRFNVLLSELDARDAQIASLQAELEVLRQARDAEVEGDSSLAGVTGAGSLGSSDADSGPGAADGSDNPAPGSVDANVLPGEEPAEVTPSGSSWVAWLTLPLVLIAFLLGLFLARRRSPDAAEEERPNVVQPENPAGFSSNITTVPAMVARPVKQAPKAPVDPLDGVELYITYGRFAEARIMLDKAIDEEPERLDLRYKQLRVLAELGDAPAFAEQEEEIKDLGGDPERVEQVKARFPLLFDDNGDMVEQVDQVEPLLDDDLEIKDSAEFQSGIPDEHDESSTSQLNLNDFTLDPDWDLIEGLSPEPSRLNAERDAAKEKARKEAKEDDFESSLHELPEVEELDHDHDEHFAPDDDDRTGGRKR